MADVFISYSQGAPEPTHALAAELVQHGIDAWFDVNLLPGQAFGKVLNGEIDRARAVITIWSRPALLSTWVPAESERAMGQSKLICVRTQDVDAKDLPIPFNRLHTPLVTDIESILGALATLGVRRGKASIGGLQAEHGQFGEAAIAWHSVKDTADPSEIEAFIEFYHAAAFYRLLATRKLARLRPAATAPAPQPAPIVKPGSVNIRIEAGMHTAAIRRLSLSADGSLMATASDDKTVRLWSLPDGNLVHTLRPPIGPGNDGKVYAVALAPNGRWAAVGGWHTESNHRVFIFDTTTGTITRCLTGLPNVTRDLEISPKGDRLAASFASQGMRVWETANWGEVAKDVDYSSDVYGLAFTPDRRLATTSYDGHIRLYGADGKLASKVKAPGGERPFSIAFSPDANLIAVVYRDTIRVDVLSAQTLALLYSADTAGIDSGYLTGIAWLAGGAQIAAAGNYPSGWQKHVLLWPDGGKGTRQSFLCAGDTIMDLAPLATGIAFCSGDPACGVLGVDGKRALFRGPPMADLRRKRGEHFLASSDGRRVRFGLKPAGEAPWLFDLAEFKLTGSPAASADLLAADIASLDVTDWINTASPKLGGKALTMDQYEIAHSLAIAPDAQTFILGGGWSLRRFDKNGTQLWKQPVPGTVWGINLARNGRVLIAAYGDGTIRWHRTEDGAELLALFIRVHWADDDTPSPKGWVAWTPEGYYHASPGAEDLIGWHVNRGDDQAADFFPVEKFSATFHQPNIVLAALDKAGA